MKDPKVLRTTFSGKTLPFLAKLRKALPKKAEVFVVGGAVRDALLGRKTKDIDLVVRLVPIKALEKTLKSFGPVELVGKNFGVFKWMPKNWFGEAIDVALPRRDHALGTGGYKDVKTQSNPRLPLVEDMQRRDFTVNALAFDVFKKHLIDDVNGLSDLREKKLRTVGEPHLRFHEDFSRMLRGLRLSVDLGFTLEDRCAKVMRISMHHLNDQTKKGEWVVPRETIGKELIRAFIANPIQAFDACYYFHVFDELFPEVMDLRGCPQPSQFHVEGDVLQHTHLAVSKIGDAGYKKYFGNEKPSALLIFAALLHDIAKPRTITFPLPGSGDRIRYNNHDVLGGEMAHAIATRLG
jgi:tRNA nucleotidyltransferase (CCA-adding enzyme)